MSGLPNKTKEKKPQRHQCHASEAMQIPWILRDHSALKISGQSPLMAPSETDGINTWVCLKMSCTPLYPMVTVMIIIPFLNGYFIGKINPTFFRQTHLVAHLTNRKCVSSPQL